MKHGKTVMFDENKHKYLSYENTLGVTEGLIFNADPGIVDEYNSLNDNEKKNFDTSKLGNGITFHGYNDAQGGLDLSQAFTKSSFIFDGVDDYIEFPYDSGNKFEDGFTFEFYGKIRGTATAYLDGKEVNNESSYNGLLNIHGEDTKSQDFWGIRFGFYTSDVGVDRIIYNLCTSGDDWTKYTGNNRGWSVKSSPWNQTIDFKNKFNDVFYYSIVYNASDNYESLYIDGVEKDSVKIDRLYWDCFLNRINKIPRVLCIGRGAMNAEVNWFYSNCECYSIKVYKRALSSQEILENYDASIDYHSYLEQSIK